MNVISIIGCVVGVTTCIIGISTFCSAQLTKAKQDGMLIAKIDQCVHGIEEIKKDMKDKNREVESILDEHSKDIATLKEQVKILFKRE